MSDVGSWLGGAADHLKVHWQAHIVPAGAFFLISFLGGMGMAVVFLAGSVGVAVMQELLGEGAALIGVGVLFAGALAAIGVTMALFQPLLLGHTRLTLDLVDAGQDKAADPGDADAKDQTLPAPAGPHEALAAIKWGYARAPAAWALLLIQVAAGMLAALFCYFPALLVGAAWFVALPAMADEECGAVDAIGISWRLVRPRYGQVLLLMLAVTAVSMVLAYIPLIGPGLTIAGLVSAQVVTYRSLLAAEARASQGVQLP